MPPPRAGPYAAASSAALAQPVKPIPILAAVQPQPPGPHLSPDGKWWWNGAQWLPTGRGMTAGSAAKAGFFGFFGMQCAACVLFCVFLVIVVGVMLASCSAVAHGIQSIPTPRPAPTLGAQ